LRNKKIAVVGALVAGLVALTGCVDSKRQIDTEETNSFRIEGTSWYGFCQGRNAFIYVPGKHDSDPDELEAVIYDDYRCEEGGAPDINPGTPEESSKPDTDPDGIIDDEKD
jgi:hypothetical protein